MRLDLYTKKKKDRIDVLAVHDQCSVNTYMKSTAFALLYQVDTDYNKLCTLARAQPHS